MARTIIHREYLGNRSPAEAYRRGEELKVQYPDAKVTVRRGKNWGPFEATVSIEGPIVTQTCGHCQFCGNQQVVKKGVLVLHGYTRPGDGQIFGRCPGVKKLPLQTGELNTITWLAKEEELLAALQADLPNHQRENDRAHAAFRKVYETTESDALYQRPTLRYRATIEQQQAFNEKHAAWEKTYPKCADYQRMAAELEQVNVAIRNTDANVRHFAGLLALKLLGTPLLTVTK